MRKSLLLAAFLAPLSAVAADAPAPSPYEPLAFLAGHCWKGDFPDGKDTDEHCFEWIYDGRFLRDRHVVHGEGHADYVGETIYYFDSAQNRLEYLYIENKGGLSRGSVANEPGVLVFPDAEFVANGKVQTYRARWKRDGADAYEVSTEFKDKDGAWAPGFALRMVLSK